MSLTLRTPETVKSMGSILSSRLIDRCWDGLFLIALLPPPPEKGNCDVLSCMPPSKVVLHALCCGPPSMRTHVLLAHAAVWLEGA